MYKLFQEAVKKYPNNIAIQYENGDSLTYNALNTRANNMAQFLIDQGIKKGEYVGVYLPPGFNAEIVRIAIYKINAVFAPIGKGELPVFIELNNQLQTQQRITYVIVEGQEYIRGHDNSVSWVDIAQFKDMSRVFDQDLHPDLQPNDIVNLFTTSGTTSAKNFVPIARSGYDDYWTPAIQEQFKGLIDSKSKIIAISQVNFDASAWERHLAWAYGAELLIVSENTRLDNKALLRCIHQFKATHAVLIPSQILTLMQQENCKEQLSSLRVICTTGEKLTKEIIQFFEDRKDEKPVIINCYGPTELTYGLSMVKVQSTDIGDDGLIRIGFPHSEKVKVYILDEDRKVVKDDNEGELFIESPYLTPGYLNHENIVQSNQQKFYDMDINGANSRKCLFKTGDIVKRRINCKNGEPELYYLRRIAMGPLKKSGEKVYPEFFENLLKEYSPVNNVHVKVHSSGLKKRLCVYVEKKSGYDLTSIELSRYLEEKHIKELFHPRIFVYDAFPLTERGKLNTKRLYAQANEEWKKDITLRQDTYLEKLILSICQVVLCQDDEVDPDKFVKSDMMSPLGFTLDPDKPLKYNGIDSKEILQIINMIEERCNVKVPITSLKNDEKVTIRKLADLVQKQRWKKTGSLTLIEEGNTNQCLYILPPITGESTKTYEKLYTKLINSFSDGAHPFVYAINARGLLDPRDATKSLDFIAEDYVKSIISEQPKGEILLLGWSFACTIARLVSEKLYKQGRQVSFMGLIDETNVKSLQKMEPRTFNKSLSELIIKLREKKIVNDEEKIVDIDENLEKAQQIKQFFEPLLKKALLENPKGNEFLILQQVMCNLLASLTVQLDSLGFYPTNNIYAYKSKETSDYSGDSDEPSSGFCKYYQGNHFDLVENDDIVDQLSQDIKKDLEQSSCKKQEIGGQIATKPEVFKFLCQHIFSGGVQNSRVELIIKHEHFYFSDINKYQQIKEGYQICDVSFYNNKRRRLNSEPSIPSVKRSSSYPSITHNEKDEGYVTPPPLVLKK